MESVSSLLTLFLEHLPHALMRQQRQRPSQHQLFARHHHVKFDLKRERNRQLASRLDRSTDRSSDLAQRMNLPIKKRLEQSMQRKQPDYMMVMAALTLEEPLLAVQVVGEDQTPMIATDAPIRTEAQILQIQLTGQILTLEK